MQANEEFQNYKWSKNNKKKSQKHVQIVFLVMLVTWQGKTDEK